MNFTTNAVESAQSDPRIPPEPMPEMLAASVNIADQVIEITSRLYGFLFADSFPATCEKQEDNCMEARVRILRSKLAEINARVINICERLGV